MSAGKNLQEMENPVTRGAKAGESMDSSAKSGYVPGHAQVDDLGGPTPENYKPDDDSAKLKEPTLSHVRNVVNAKAKAAEGMDASKKNTYGEAAETEEEIVDEATIDNEEVVTEEDVNIEEDVAALFSGEELSEDFQEKAKVIFEATVKAKVSEVRGNWKKHMLHALSKKLKRSRKNWSLASMLTWSTFPKSGSRKTNCRSSTVSKQK